MRTFNFREHTDVKPKLFFDESGTVDIQRYDIVKYPIFKRLLETQIANYWRPTEINLSKDKVDFREFTPAEEHVFTGNIRRQIVLDSVQGRAPMICYGPIVSDSIIESFLGAWTFFEQIHSQSYTHILENVYADASKVYDQTKEIQQIVECGNDISHYYDKLLQCQHELPWGDYQTKKAFYLSLVATNALEQLRFHVSFACTFSFANRKKMEGTGRIVTMIRQDEALHCAFTEALLKYLPKDDPEFIQIAEECKNEATEIYLNVRQQERSWVTDYLFQKGPIIGMTQDELLVHLDRLCGTKMKKHGLIPDFEIPKHEPLLWMGKYLNESGIDDQPPPQEEELTNYQIGNVDMNINRNKLMLDF